MKGKLIKSDIQYRFHNEDGLVIATSTNGKLSLKNCQAIECGYDLDELAVEVLTQYNWETFPSTIKVFKAGFQKALELMGDKKFSLEDMKKAYLGSSKYEWFGDLIQSLQQTEWDVEIEMEKVPVKMPGVMVFTKAPKLDDEGCLILKRI